MPELFRTLALCVKTVEKSIHKFDTIPDKFKPRRCVKKLCKLSVVRFLISYQTGLLQMETGEISNVKRKKPESKKIRKKTLRSCVQSR